jgi:hypothetical protein
MPINSSLGSISINGFKTPKNVVKESMYSISMNSVTADYVGLSSEVALTGSFTMETWVKFNSGGVSQHPMICGSNTTSNCQFRIGGNGTTGPVTFYANGIFAQSTTVVNDGVWTHVAITRDASNNLYIFVNGNRDTISSYAGTFYITRLGSVFNDDLYSGLMHGYRAINGTCLYTSNFSVPTSNFTAPAGTVILTGQKSTLTNEVSGITLSVGNSATIVSQGPF